MKLWPRHNHQALWHLVARSRPGPVLKGDPLAMHVPPGQRNVKAVLADFLVSRALKDSATL